MPIYERHTAKIEGDFVVFLIGARLVKPWLFWNMIPVGRAMAAMIAELEAHPELGYLGRKRGTAGPRCRSSTGGPAIS